MLPYTRGLFNYHGSHNKAATRVYPSTPSRESRQLHWPSKLGPDHFNHESPSSHVGNRLNKCNPLHVLNLKVCHLNLACVFCCRRETDLLQPLNSLCGVHQPLRVVSSMVSPANHAPLELHPTLLTPQPHVAVVDVAQRRHVRHDDPSQLPLAVEWRLASLP